MQIRDRIKELRRVKASSLIPNEANWRKHPKKQRKVLKALLTEIGYSQALLAREDNGRLILIDGHLRAETTPDEMVPVLILDVTEAEASKLLATLDPLAAMAETDAGKLDSLLQNLQPSADAVASMLADLAKDNGLYESDSDADGQDEQGEDYIPPVERGIFAYKEDAIFSSNNGWGIPSLRPDMLSDQIPECVWNGLSTDDASKTLFVWSSSRMTPENCAGGVLAFYVADHRFDSVWVEAVRTLDKLVRFGWGSVVAPDFSLIGDYPRVTQMWAAYRSYWCARYWQEAGVRIIPNIVWAGEWADEWLWKAIPHKPPVVSLQWRTGGERENEYRLRGVKAAFAQIEPLNAIIYGGDDHREWLSANLPVGPKYHYLSTYTRVRMDRNVTR